MMSNTEITTTLMRAGYVPADGNVGTKFDDGAYFQFSAKSEDEGCVQIVIKGPMTLTPGQHAARLPGYRIRGVAFIDPSDDMTPAECAEVLSTGFYSIILAPPAN